MSGKDKKTLSKNAVQSVKQRTDDLIEDDGFDIDGEIDEAARLDQATSQSKKAINSRKELEDYLEEQRLRRELQDDFDL